MSELKKGTSATRAKNKYNSNNYDSLRIVVPKGRKEDVEGYAQSKGESVNGLVNALLRADMGLSEEEWKSRPSTLPAGDSTDRDVPE